MNHRKTIDAGAEAKLERRTPTAVNEVASDPLTLAPAQQKWVDDTLARLTLRRKIAQLMHPMLTHYNLDIPQEDITRMVVDEQLGGAFLFPRPYKKLREIVQEVAPQMDVPLLFSGDHESGANTIEDGTRFGSSMTFGAIEDIEEGKRLAYEVGRVAAIQAAAVGTFWSLAPVVDLQINPDNPITNNRAYSDQVERIVALSTAYIRGMQDHGMAATIKHFPGDGMDARDQHIVTSINPLTLEEWRQSYGRTFSAGIAAGTYTVMIGHIALAHYSGRHPKTGRLLPATIDPRIQIDLLRNQLGFKGLVISDAIEMNGLRTHCESEGECALLNLATGSDMVLFVADARRAIDAVLRGLDQGVISEERINDATRRVLTLKAKLKVNEARALPEDAETARIFTHGQYDAIATAIGEKSLTLVRDTDGLYPTNLKTGSKIVLFEMPLEQTEIAAMTVGEKTDKARPKTAMHEALEERGFRVASVEEMTGYKSEIQDADALIYIFHSSPQAGRGSIRLSLRALRFLDWSRIISTAPTFFVSLGNPYIIWELSGIRNFVCGYSNAPGIQRAYVRALLGEIPFIGKLPITIPEIL